MLGPDEAARVLAKANSTGWAVFHADAVAEGDTQAMAAMARAFGEPSSDDGGPLWPISRRAATGTFSLTAAEAPLHTDAQYRPRPERAFLLFCVRSADCGGGASRLLSASDAIGGLADSLPAKHVRLLHQQVWRWTAPEVFRTTSDVRSIARAVIGEDGGLRWRFNNLEVDSHSLRAAALSFHRHLEEHPAVTTLCLTAGDVLYCDNARVLHGRTAFEDPGRLLYRTRLW